MHRGLDPPFREAAGRLTRPLYRAKRRDLLKEAGYRYVMDWAMDDQPVWMRTRAGPILSVPYPLEINDSPALVFRRHTGRQFGEMIVDQFDEMLEQSRKYPLVFTVSAHPLIIGQPSAAFRRDDHDPENCLISIAHSRPTDGSGRGPRLDEIG